MRIVDQNKDFSIEFEMAVLGVEERFVKADIGSRSYYLGIYTDKERALEVLHEIHHSYELRNAIFTNVDLDDDLLNELEKLKINGGLIIKDSKENSKVEFIGKSVYYMPES